jgi:hypothetical protein
VQNTKENQNHPTRTWGLELAKGPSSQFHHVTRAVTHGVGQDGSGVSCA